MHNISKHDTKEEWEGHTCEYGWIDLLVGWNTIGINNLLEDCCKFIGLEQSWLY
jgi:hypothetical protein